MSFKKLTLIGRMKLRKPLSLLIRASEGEEAGKSKLVRSVEIISENSSKMKQRLESIAANAIGGLATHGVVTAIQFVHDIASKA